MLVFEVDAKFDQFSFGRHQFYWLCCVPVACPNLRLSFHDSIPGTVPRSLYLGTLHDKGSYVEDYIGEYYRGYEAGKLGVQTIGFITR